MAKLYESDFEEATIARLKQLGYRHMPAHELYARTSLSEVVLRDRLEDFLRRRYPGVPTGPLAAQFASPDGLTWQQRNERFHQSFVRGLDFGYDVGGETQYVHAMPVDWEHPENNDFLVVNQLPIAGKMPRRPDVLIYINGFPLIVFELKSPFHEKTSVDDAYTQIQNYTYDISQLFDYNAFSVISDGTTTLHGMPSAPLDYFAAWKSINGRTVDNQIANSMKTLIEGLFPKERLLEYLCDFIVFMNDGKKTLKIGAKYHQFFGVRFAVAETVRATRPNGNRRIGVIWHTQGSGKSISMLFFSSILARHPAMANPSIVIQVDRADLDQQLYDTFVAGESRIGPVHQASSADDLRDWLKNDAGQIVFSTIEKFRLKESESQHPVLSERRNIVVIADEAHRTQYGEDGFAGNLKRALPNASFIGFTGTPISFADRDTVEVFGNIIHTYDMVQSVEDNATVPIYYESRLIPLDLTNTNIDEDYATIVAAVESGDALDQHKAKWAALEKVVGTKDRIQTLAQDLLNHFSTRATEHDKAMVVCMSREICVALAEALRALHGCPEIEVIMSDDVRKDPAQWREKSPGSAYAHIKSKEEKEEVKAKLKDPDDPLKMVLVRDMWLTGFDAPPVSTLYVDKPMKGHTLMQAIARVNRIFPDKAGGLVVDYIGIATALKEATQRYTDGGGTGKPALDMEQAVSVFQSALEEVRIQFPKGLDVITWRGLPHMERDDFIAERVNDLYGKNEEAFLQAELRLKKSYQLVKHLDAILALANEVLLYDIVATQLRKLAHPSSGGGQRKAVDEQVANLVNESVEAHEVLDLFQVAGLERPDLSILDEAFLADFQEKKHEDLRLKLLKRLLEEKIAVIFRQNLAMSKSLKELLEKTLADYHARVIQGADVMNTMMEVNRRINTEKKFRTDLGLSEEEVAFYTIVARLGQGTFSNEFMAGLVHKIVKAMKKEFKPDWTSSHRTDVLSAVNLAVKQVLIREKVKGEQLRSELTKAIIEEAKEQYKDWPLDA